MLPAGPDEHRRYHPVDRDRGRGVSPTRGTLRSPTGPCREVGSGPEFRGMYSQTVQPGGLHWAGRAAASVLCARRGTPDPDDPTEILMHRWTSGGI